MVIHTRMTTYSVSLISQGGGGGLSYKKDGGAHRTFYGLKKQFCTS